MDLGDVGGEAWVWDAATAVTAAIDLWEVAMNAGVVARVGGMTLYQTTDLGDAAHEIIGFQFLWGNTASGSGGGTPTAITTGFGSGSQPTVECRNTTQATGGSPSKGVSHGWNVLQPLDLWYPNGLEPRLAPTDGAGELNVVRLLAAPADSLTMYSTLFIRRGYDRA